METNRIEWIPPGPSMAEEDSGYFTPKSIFDWKDRQYETGKGYLTFRLYASGWLVRFTPFGTPPAKQEKIEDVDVLTACRWANDRVA
jgi:hypothetical protein